MKRTSTSLVALSLALCLTLGVLVFPAGAAYTDLPASHWAYDDMTKAVAFGIINGKGDGRMDPQGTLTWGQFLAMFCRAFAGDDYRAAVQNGLAWDAAGYYTALEHGFLQEYDFLQVDPGNLSKPISRQETAVLLDRALPENASRYVYHWEEFEPADTALSDFGQMHEEYQDAVRNLFDLEIVKGKSDGSFGWGDALHRSDGTVLIMRALKLADRVNSGTRMTIRLVLMDRAGNVLVPQFEVETYVNAFLPYLAEQYAPRGYKADYSAFISEVCSAQKGYTLYLDKMTEWELEQHDAIERVFAGELSWEEYYAMDFWLHFQGDSPAKHEFLYGNEDQSRYASQSEAEQHMKVVKVPVWRLKNGQKVSGTASFSIHEKLVDDVLAIFTEIYNDPEQFPIADVGGYSWRGNSATGEHNCGTAIDINANQNCQMRDGKVVAGSYWKPGEDPYSIPEHGSVVRIFAEHGWTWGGTAWYSTQDYMHFSYMGN